MTIGLVWVAATLICTVLNAAKRQWVLTMAWLCLAIYVVLSREILAHSLPTWAVTSFSFAFLALVVYDAARKKTSQGE
jgi:hypothetical protein